MTNQYLLDTHVLLWYLNGDQRITQKPQQIIADFENQCFISIASIWDVAIKIQIGKLKLDINLKELRKKLNEEKIEILPLAYEHIMEILPLEKHHKDPFDRIIIAQAKFEKLTVITKDENFQKYKVITTFWKSGTVTL
jgi:PIN domain nuclease of toxin-antitoxin system